jgi:hypothetical protein
MSISSLKSKQHAQASLDDTLSVLKELTDPVKDQEMALGHA